MARSLSIGKAVPGYPYTSPNFSKNDFFASHFSSGFTDAYVPFSNWEIRVRPKKPNMTRIQFNARCKNKLSSEAFSSQKNFPIARNPKFLSQSSQSNPLFRSNLQTPRFFYSLPRDSNPSLRKAILTTTSLLTFISNRNRKFLVKWYFVKALNGISCFKSPVLLKPPDASILLQPSERFQSFTPGCNTYYCLLAHFHFGPQSQILGQMILCEILLAPKAFKAKSEAIWAL